MSVGRWLPILATALLGGLLSVLGCLAVLRAEDDAITRAVAEEADAIADRVDSDFGARADALVAMAARWRQAGGFTRESWERDVSQHAATLPASFQAIERVGPDGIVQWAVPNDAHEIAVGRDLSAEADRLPAMRTSRETGAPALALPATLLQGGGMGILVFVPLQVGARFDGWLVGVVGIDAFVWEAQRAAPGYRVVVTARDRVIYASPSEAVTGFCVARLLSAVDPTSRLEVCAEPRLVAAARGSAPAITLVAGLAITLLSSVLAGALGVARSRSRALERAQREFADLSYAVSHEMHTPLRAIDGHAAILAEGELPEAARFAVARIRANVQRMGMQVEGLIELMRIVRYQPTPRRVDVSALARELLAALAAAHPDREVAVHVADGLVVRAGPNLVRVVLSALLDNAWKFTGGRDPAIIEVGPVPGGFYVRDTGVGFDMAYGGKLFGTFETLHAPGEFVGLGLGLAIAARAAESLGATLTATSRPGEGATFHVVFGRRARRPGRKRAGE